MNIEPVHVIAIFAVGVGATIILDIWSLLLKRALNVPSPNYCFVGRWLSYMPEGTFKHPGIAASAPKRFECMVGWIAHYVVGVLFAAGFVFVVSPNWLQQPTLPPALLFGIVTVAMPFLVMQPAFGFGVAASKTPNPTQARLRSLMVHTVFGVGLYISATIVNRFITTYA